ncbi:MAG: TadE/TadG family type IV pilus assembly protein [Desulfosarcinaceae bacterium]
MVEFVIVFPVLMLFFLVILQTTMLLNARQMVHYASFYAARAAIVGASAQTAAEVACAPLAPGPNNMVAFPVKVGLSNLLTTVEVETDGEDVTANVVHYYAMRVPLINKIFFEIFSEGNLPQDLLDHINSLSQLAGLGAVLGGATTVEHPWEVLKTRLPGDFPFYPMPIRARTTMTREREFRATPDCCQT